MLRPDGGKLAFPRRSKSDGDAKMKKTLVNSRQLAGLRHVSVSAASAKTVIIKKGRYHHHHPHHGGYKKVIIKHGH